MQEAVLLVLPGLALATQVTVDFRVGDDEPGIDLALPEARDKKLVAQVFAKAVDVDALFAKRLAELLRRHLVLLGDPLDGAVDLGFLDAQAGVLRVLDQDARRDQPVEQLLLEQFTLRLRRALPREFAGRDPDLVVELEPRDRFRVDHCDDAIQGNRFARPVARCRVGGGDQQGARQDAAGEREQGSQRTDHGVGAPGGSYCAG